MLGPGVSGGNGWRLPPLVSQASAASSGSQRRVSISTPAATCGRQSTTTNVRAVSRSSLVDKRSALQVFGDGGKDVTPHPLFTSDSSTAIARQGKLLAPSTCPWATGSSLLSFLSTIQTTEVNATVGSFPRTHRSSRSSVPNALTAVPMLDEIPKPGSGGDIPDVQMRQGEIKEQLTEEDLDRRVDVFLTETETLWILEKPSVVVSAESEDAARIQERNRIYADVCKARPGNDRFVAKAMQTLDTAAKNKEAQCDKIILEDKGVMVTSWDLYDSFHAPEINPRSRAEGIRATARRSSESHPAEEQHQPTSGTSDTGSKTSSTSMLESATPARSHKDEKHCSEAILTSENFQQGLVFVERILMENIFQPKLAVYRQFPVFRDSDVITDTAAAVKEADQEGHDEEKNKEEHEEKKDKEEEVLTDPSILSDLNRTPEELDPSMEWLWSYTCDLTNGYSVSSMAWSKENPDLLAVGYRTFDFKEQKKGLACCWSLKNPMWPERIFWCEHGVTALDFSMACPNLLAVGMYDGSVAIFSVESCDTSSLWDSSDSSNSHTGPVWQLKWVEQDRGAKGGGKKERLFCVSADGRITEWFLQPRLDCTDVMKLKRTERVRKIFPGENKRKSEALLSREAPGMCFDFHPKDTNVYLAGTEEGHIHLCSCSCDEWFLKTYRGHKAPVYKVAWNPFSTDMFLSCSADWKIILWHQDSQAPILTFCSTAVFVHDIMWSPKSEFIFAAAHESRAEIWDLRVSILDPTISYSASPGETFTSVLFAKNTDCLLVGDSKGEVSVFELQNLAVASSSQVGTLHDILGPALAV
ncbi:dynein axonemal intermediate chain 4 [Melanerpes formicivorus]|uniref:dynein axonemal intermediate chain 4 n=1 Tax=Melanerpes formicivorus TaxID=211600 RepID=UPI00358FA6BB